MYITELSVVFILSLFMMLLLNNKFYLLLKNSNYIIKNYRGKETVNIMGISIIITIFLSIVILVAFGINFNKYEYYIFFISSFMGFIGLIDDILGKSDTKGFRGHLYNLLKGNLTSGGVKALIGFFLALMVSVLLNIDNVIIIIINTILISLTTNLMNLFDTRPGRSLKIFLLFSFILLLSYPSKLLIISVAICLVYIPYDLQEKSILGDVGSNFLGFYAGALLVYYMNNLNIKIIILLIVLVLNLLSEVKSFNNIIINNKVFNYIDRLGRKK